MRELKREKATLEAQLADVEKRSQHHDDHLRTLDVWFDQVTISPVLDLHDANCAIVHRRDQTQKRGTTARSLG